MEARLRDRDEALAAAIAGYDGFVAGFARECAPSAPDPSIKETLLARLADKEQEPAPPLRQALAVARASESEWVPLEVEGVLIDGASIRVLSLDAAGGRVTTSLSNRYTDQWIVSDEAPCAAFRAPFGSPRSPPRLDEATSNQEAARARIPDGVQSRSRSGVLP